MPLFVPDHIALSVKDLAASRRFYEFLGGRVVSKPSKNFLEIMLGTQRIHLVPDAHTTFDFLGNNAKRENGETPRAGIDHFCLTVASVTDLEFLACRLTDSPFPGSSAVKLVESPKLGDGFSAHCEERPPLKTLYFSDPDGIALEVRAYQH